MKIEINGIDKEVSKETCALAVTDYFAKHPEPKPEPKYQFQSGDVAKGEYGDIRIIMELRGTEILASFGIGGECENASGQSGFEDNGYKKVGVLKDFIKEYG